MHDRGVVAGDLHPFNVLIRPDGQIVLIDFEGSAGVEENRRPTLAAPGFRAPQDRSGFDIDRYALACMRLFLFLPLTMLLPLDVTKAGHLAEVITEVFPVPQRFLTDAVQTITGETQPVAGARRRRAPRLDPDRPGWERARGSMAQAIVRSAPRNATTGSSRGMSSSSRPAG